MKRTLVLGALCFLLLTGCYVRTKLDTQNRQLPADFSAPVLVVTLQEKVGLGEAYAVRLEQDAMQALTANGVKCISLNRATSGAGEARTTEVLRENKYRALLRILITFWGSKTEQLSESVPPSVQSAQDDRGSTFRPPTALDYGEERPGPMTSYKEVAMIGSLMDLQGNRVVWSGQVSAKPAVVGRSFLYHRFNQNLKYEELADRCFQKLAKKLSKVLKED